MPQFCAIIGCGASSKKDKDCSFYRFPSEKDNRSRINEQAVRRRKAWILSLKRNDLTEQKLKNERVCSRHFILGKPAALTDEGNPDWIPSQKMGYKKHTSQNAMKRYERLKNRAQVCCSVAEMEDRDIKLIALVKQYPYLYDRGDTNFKNKPLIEKSWRVIASHMKTSSEDCQRRWCVLRNRYAKEKRENNILDPNRREWSLMKSFDFLDVHVKTRKSFNKPTSPQNEIYLEEHPATKVGKWEEIIIDEVKIDHNSTEKMCRNFVYSDQSDSSFRNDDESNRCKSAIVVPQLENILEKRNPDSLGNSFCEVANNKNVSFDTESATSEDSTMHFCLSLHEPLSKIPTKFITKAKIEILQVLDKYENA